MGENLEEPMQMMGEPSNKEMFLLELESYIAQIAEIETEYGNVSEELVIVLRRFCMMVKRYDEANPALLPMYLQVLLINKRLYLRSLEKIRKDSRLEKAKMRKGMSSGRRDSPSSSSRRIEDFSDASTQDDSEKTEALIEENIKTEISRLEKWYSRNTREIRVEINQWLKLNAVEKQKDDMAKWRFKDDFQIGIMEKTQSDLTRHNSSTMSKLTLAGEGKLTSTAMFSPCVGILFTMSAINAQSSSQIAYLFSTTIQKKSIFEKRVAEETNTAQGTKNTKANGEKGDDATKGKNDSSSSAKDASKKDDTSPSSSPQFKDTKSKDAAKSKDSTASGPEKERKSSRPLSSFLEDHPMLVGTVASTTSLLATLFLSAGAQATRTGVLTTADTVYNITSTGVDLLLPDRLGIGKWLVRGSMSGAYTAGRTTVEAGFTVAETVVRYMPMETVMTSSARLGAYVGDSAWSGIQSLSNLTGGGSSSSTSYPAAEQIEPAVREADVESQLVDATSNTVNTASSGSASPAGATSSPVSSSNTGNATSSTANAMSTTSPQDQATPNKDPRDKTSSLPAPILATSWFSLPSWTSSSTANTSNSTTQANRSPSSVSGSQGNANPAKPGQATASENQNETAQTTSPIVDSLPEVRVFSDAREDDNGDGLRTPPPIGTTDLTRYLVEDQYVSPPSTDQEDGKNRDSLTNKKNDERNGRNIVLGSPARSPAASNNCSAERKDSPEKSEGSPQKNSTPEKKPDSPAENKPGSPAEKDGPSSFFAAMGDALAQSGAAVVTGTNAVVASTADFVVSGSNAVASGTSAVVSTTTDLVVSSSNVVASGTSAVVSTTTDLVVSSSNAVVSTTSTLLQRRH